MREILPIAYHYAPLREVGALNDEQSRFWDAGPTAPLQFKLWDNFMEGRINDAEYRRAKGDWFLEKLSEEREQCVLRDYKSTIGAATNAFALKSALQDPERGAIFRIIIEGNIVAKRLYGPESYEYRHVHVPYKDDQVYTPEDVMAQKYLRWRGRVPLADVVSAKVDSPLNAMLYPEQLDPYGLFANKGTDAEASHAYIKMDIFGALAAMRGRNNDVVLPPTHVAAELNRMLGFGIMTIMRQSVQKARQYAPLGGERFAFHQLADAVFAEKSMDKQVIRAAWQKTLKLNNKPDGYAMARQRQRAAKDVAAILERGPLIAAL